MPSSVVPGPISNDAAVREAVCIQTQKIYDSCKDKDCVEDLRLYLTAASQAIVNNSVSVRGKSASLLYISSDVEEVSFNRGYYTVDMRFYYKVKCEVLAPNGRNSEITGLSIFDKRVILFGSEGSVKSFTSNDTAFSANFGAQPVASIEAVDPIILGAKVLDKEEMCCYDLEGVEIPTAIRSAFDEDLVFDPSQRRIYVTLGQFSIVRLQRATQLLIPVYDYCMPCKECSASEGDDPCTLFSRISFPVDEFFPPDSICQDDSYGATIAAATK